MIVFDERKERFNSVFPDLLGEWHVFSINVDGTNLHPITAGLKGYNLIADISPDGHRILIESVSNFYVDYTYCDLYVMNSDGTNPTKISNQHLTQLAMGTKTAYWMDDQSIAFIAKNGVGSAIWSIKLDGSAPQLITNPDQIPSRLIPSSNPNEIYWIESADQENLNHFSGFRITQRSSMETITIDDYSPLFIFDRSMIVEENYKLYLLSGENGNKRYIGETLCSPCLFPSPDGLKLILNNFSDESAHESQLLFFHDFSKVILSEPIARAYWTPDSRQVLLFGGNQPYILNVETMEISSTIPTDHFLSQWRGIELFWLPDDP